MACIMRNVVRAGVIGALATGGLVLIAGPHRVGALFTQTKDAINRKIDNNIKDPVALRAQLRDLEAQYPQKIGQVRSDLAQLREQLGQLERDLAVSQRVVDLAQSDAQTLDSQIARAGEAVIQAVAQGDASARIVIVHQGERLSVEQARSRVDQALATRNAYAERSADISTQLGYLREQESRMVEVLERLESEQLAFRTQLFDLDRQIDAIARNERMIDMLESTQQTIDEHSRYEAASLDHLRGRLADVRARQEAALEQFSATTSRRGYEERAKMELDGVAPRAVAPTPATPTQGRVIEIGPDADGGAEESAEDGDSVASSAGVR